MSRLSASDRVTRLLAVIPWVASRPGVHLDEIAERFDYPRANLEADLLEAVQFVGVYPFTPDTMIEVTLDDDQVWIHYADWFAKPLRLTAEQAVALMAAGESVLALSGDDNGPLLGGLTKLGAALGVDQGLDIRLGSAPEETLDLLRTAVTDHRVVELDYYTFGRDERTHRSIEPTRFFADEGKWYVSAHCRLADDERVFRVDRIVDAKLLDETFASRGEGGVGVFTARDDDPRVTLEVTADAAWVVQQYPNEGVEELDDGGFRLTLAVAAIPWLERLLIRLGSAARIVDGDPSVPPDLVRGTAERVLARYQATQ